MPQIMPAATRITAARKLKDEAFIVVPPKDKMRRETRIVHGD
jgi:hypothetical protein